MNARPHTAPALRVGQPLQLDLPPAVATALRSARRYLLDDGTPLYALAFDAERFRLQAFAAAAIACPDSVARSVRKRQAEFLFGRLAARLALGEALGPAQAQAEITIDATRAPRWPTGSLGSISHSGGCAAAVALPASQGRGIGIDLERLLAPTAREAVLGVAIDTTETSLLAAAADAQWPHDALLTALFSAKESLFKAAFGAVGRYFDFAAARLCAVDLAQQRLRLRLTETLCAQFVEGQRCEIGFARLDLDTQLVLTHYAW
ncbi:4'-phosphopantetheinyl transferase family protein [Xanthomonas translucens]|uniref:4'-phosphopantetheinyl transferase family protein n=3 Tax=Xanthomonas campestris pv. translucens TaxID=343 RepID=UPI00071E8DEC|nr:4'-phosphopantetheinyl transferase superfamily protein [Xanthomonas translucens]QEN93982.1 4'-phosphopantetheinyl transferase superfamily protein [Xanthomonas translucens pv. undulosa]QSQ40124.1 4'-phosphopantetheinyl transferase superfamily protein [Xanthomonas translucens pv. translucens]QSQ48678.1 4'-phosphopantetheinyl transferase superfamily protein [Xanthomonas translucens pv. undulosa]UPU47410.1 4'-phosphopantetheinyl transferase superfamily protein [Xanthomonas translucens pv. undulo